MIPLAEQIKSSKKAEANNVQNVTEYFEAQK